MSIRFLHASIHVEVTCSCGTKAVLCGRGAKTNEEAAAVTAPRFLALGWTFDGDRPSVGKWRCGGCGGPRAPNLAIVEKPRG